MDGAIHPLYFRILPLNGPPPGGNTYVVVWPDRLDGIHNAHPDRGVLDSVAGDVLVQWQERYRMLAVQRFNDWNGPSFASVRECMQPVLCRPVLIDGLPKRKNERLRERSANRDPPD